MTRTDRDRLRRIDRRRRSFPRSSGRADVVMRVALGSGVASGVLSELAFLAGKLGPVESYVPGACLAMGLLVGALLGLLPGFAMLLFAREPRRAHFWIGAAAALLYFLVLQGT